MERQATGILQSNHILVLENSPVFLQVLLEFLPKEPLDITWHFAVDTREKTNFDLSVVRKNVISDVRDVICKTRHPNVILDVNAFIYDGQKMMEAVRPLSLTQPEIDFWNLHSMTMKLASQMYLFSILGISKFLYIDDDVAIFRNPKPLFDREAFLQAMHFNKMSDNEYYREIQRISGFILPVSEYNQHNGCAGVMLMNLAINSALLSSVNRFFSSTYLLDLYQKYLVKTGHPYNKLFFADQVLMNILYAAHQYYEKPKEAVWTTGFKQSLTPKGKPIVSRKVPILIHYGAGKNKQSWIDYFRSEGWKQSLTNL